MTKPAHTPYSVKIPFSSREAAELRRLAAMFWDSGLYDERAPGIPDTVRACVHFTSWFFGVGVERLDMKSIDALRLFCMQRHDKPGTPLRENLDGRETVIPDEIATGK